MSLIHLYGKNTFHRNCYLQSPNIHATPNSKRRRKSSPERWCSASSCLSNHQTSPAGSRRARPIRSQKAERGGKDGGAAVGCELLEKSAGDRPSGGTSCCSLIDTNSQHFRIYFTELAGLVERMFAESSWPSIAFCKWVFTNKPLTTWAL